MSVVESALALIAVRVDMTMAPMVKKVDVQAAQITQWKHKLLSTEKEAFDEAA